LNYIKKHRSTILLFLGFCLCLFLLFESTKHPSVNSVPERTILPSANYVVVMMVKCVLILTGLSLLFVLFFNLVVKDELKLKALGKNFASIFFTVAILFLGLEMVFLFFARSNTVGYTLSSCRWLDYNWKPRNSFSYRDDDFSPDTLRGKKIVFAMGDSFTAGYGIDNYKDRYSNRLDDMLPDNFKVLNVGVNGFDTKSQLFLLRQIELKPDILVLQYYINDIQNIAEDMGMEFEGYTPYEDVFPALKYFVKRSYLLNHVYWSLPRKDTNSFHDFLKSAFEDKEILTAQN